MLSARGRRARAARPRSQFFTKQTDSRPITNVALGSEIKKQFRLTYPIIISFCSCAERGKNKTPISIIAAEIFFPHFPHLKVNVKKK